MEHRAVVLDPHPLWIEALGVVLASLRIEVVGKAHRAEDALELVDEHQPDIFLIETALPGETSGAALVRAARQAVPSLRVIAISASAEPKDIDAAFDAGALVYVVKTAHPDDVAATIRQAFDHSIYVARGQAQGVTPHMPRRTTEESRGESGLTRREREILALVAEGHSNRQVARLLWVTEQTVKFHLSNIYRKLNVSNRTEASRWAHKHRLVGVAGPGRERGSDDSPLRLELAREA
jgi:DNA-binding NarL/FixJ family response regulator